MVKRKKQSKPARHTNAAPFACVGEIRLSIEPNPLQVLEGQFLITERCTGCGSLLDVRTVVEALNNDDEDDGA